MSITATATAPKAPRLSPDEHKHLFERTGVAQYVDTADAAALLNVAPQTLRRWACEGSGPLRPIRVNGRLRWAVEGIQAVLAGVPA